MSSPRRAADHPPKRVRRTAVAAAVVIAGSTLAAGTTRAAAEPPPDSPSWCRPSGDLRAEEMPENVRDSDCDLRGRSVRARTVAAPVPTAGHTATANALLTDGSEDLEVTTAPDGRSWTVHSHEHRATPGGVSFNVDSAPQGNACTDSTSLARNYVTPSNQRWFFNPTYQPSYISGSTQDEIARGIDRMVRGVNNCGFGATTAAYASYVGTTTARPNISGDMLRCLPADSNPIVAWGSSTANTLALNCTLKSSTSQFVVDTDTQFNAYHPWDDVVSDGCRTVNGKYAYDIEAVATHEWGHAVGMGDLTSSTNSEQTMFATVNACDAKTRTLGLGDRNYMVQRYGYR